VSVACGLSTLVILAAFGVVLHHQIQASIVSWERSNLDALGHHVAEMVAPLPPDQRAETVADLARDLAALGVGVGLAATPGRPRAGLRCPWAKPEPQCG
jgi:hypothetical protein